MKTVANCLNLGEAQHFKTVLEAAGIPSFIPDEMSAGIAPHLFYTSGSGVRLQVADENADEAQEIIRDIQGNADRE